VPRLATLLAVLLLAFPAAAFAQGAGDDQYQDPFGEEPAQTDDDGGGLSETPPGGGSDGGSDSSGGDTGGGDTSGTPAPATPAPEATASNQLPNTGTDPRVLGLLGSTLLLAGVGLRLRTIDPDAY
jgi:LPXTG-motif cell wall-anchored protein